VVDLRSASSLRFVQGFHNQLHVAGHDDECIACISLMAAGDARARRIAAEALIAAIAL
jgi:hypothetical protein